MTGRALVIGDATLDVTVRHAEPPLPGTDGPADISVGPGGQGSNVAVRLARRGWEVRLLTVLGQDGPGQLLSRWLVAEGITVVGPHAPASGVVLSMVDADGERGMLSHRIGLPPNEVSAAALRDRAAEADWVHASGYALADATSGPELARGLAALSAERPVSVAGGSFHGGDVAAGWRAIRPWLSVFDRAEGELMAGRPAVPDELAQQLASDSGGVVVITKGPAGAVASLPDGSTVSIGPAGNVAALDATGAGDAFTAALIDALAGRAWPLDATDLATGLQGAGVAGAGAAAVVGAQGRIAGERPAGA